MAASTAVSSFAMGPPVPVWEVLLRTWLPLHTLAAAANGFWRLSRSAVRTLFAGGSRAHGILTDQ